MHELERLIQSGESETLEFKKSTAALPSAFETLCGFLNKQGGKVLFGVSDGKKAVGQQVSDATIREISDHIKKIEPPVHVSIERIPLQDSKEVVQLYVFPQQSDVPYVYMGRPFQRIGSTTSLMPQHTYQKMLLERNHHKHRWEIEAADGYNIEDLDVNEILKTVRMGITAGRIPDHQEEDIASILDRFELRKSGRLLNAAVVLFGKKFLPNFMQCNLRLARFKGVDKSEFIDQNQMFGNAFFLLDEAMLFLRRHLPIAGKILPGALERSDEPLFPLISLREALVNAFCHRSYTIPGGAISVAIFDNRLEIWNDGTLLFGLTPSDLKKDHPSRQRNPLIASIFYYRGLIEKWGRGTQKIVSLCVKAGHPEPDFFEQADSFVIRFIPSGYIAPHRVSHNLTERQRFILHILSLAQSNGITFTEVKSKLKDPPANRTLQDDFQHLKRLELVEVTGHGRGAKWSLTPVNNAE